MAKKHQSIEDYEKYMETINYVIRDTEERMKLLEQRKKIASLSYDDWVKWLNKEIEL